MLEFEHIVQVNDLTDAGVRALTRRQLWQGLVMRARFPEQFNNSLQCQSHPVDSHNFIRTIAVGESTFREHVVLTPEQHICTRSVPDPDQIQTESMTRIEEPETGSLFVRFAYKRELHDLDERVDVAEHLKAAYVQVDRDAIAMIRLLAQSELFDKTIN